MALIGKNNRKSVLDENASIYQEQTQKSEKQKWSEMNFNERWLYFADYYLAKVIVVVIVIGVVGGFLWNLLRPEIPVALSVAVVENTLAPKGKDTFQQFLEEICVSDTAEQNVRVDDSYGTGYEGLAKLQAYMGANDIDIIITNEQHFCELAQAGYFTDLETLVPQLVKQQEDNVCRTAGYSEVEEGSTAEDEDAQENTKNTADDDIVRAYGIRITDCAQFQDAWYEDAEAVAGIVLDSKQQENAVRVLEALFE